MKKILLLYLLVLSNFLTAQTKTIHVFVALCDNEHQGIVPVPAQIGNGKDPKNNLYWGAGYGVKSFFKLKTTDWKLIANPPTNNPYILERILFKHTSKNVYLLADAYDGEKIKNCISNFLKAANRQNPETITYNSQKLKFGGAANLIAYVGHNGLMDFNITMDYNLVPSQKTDIMILACYSKQYFAKEIRNAQANPVLWTTHLMAPEAYTLKAAIDGWILNETGKQIAERAAQTYNKYQKCGIKGARNLFTSGF